MPLFRIYNSVPKFSSLVFTSLKAASTAVLQSAISRDFVGLFLCVLGPLVLVSGILFPCAPGFV